MYFSSMVLMNLVINAFIFCGMVLEYWTITGIIISFNFSLKSSIESSGEMYLRNPVSYLMNTAPLFAVRLEAENTNITMED